MATQLFRAVRERWQSYQPLSPEPGATVVHQGWLEKKGLICRRWKHLYFILWSDGSFLGYDGRPITRLLKPAHKYVIQGRRIEARATGNQYENYQFHISGTRGTCFMKLIFRAESNDCRTSWMNALRQVEAEVTHRSNAQRRVPRPATIEDFDILRQLGGGSYGKVQLCRERNTGKLYALKTISKLALPNNCDVSVYSEKNILATNNHPFLTKLHCCFEADITMVFIMEYASGGNLASHLKRNHRLNQREACFYAAQITAGVGYLHSRQVIYRDLKPDNILIAADGYLKLADFGLARKLSDSEGTASFYCGTLYYLAPEMLHGRRYGRAVDWWSFGIVVFEMLTGQTPFAHSRDAATRVSIIADSVKFPQYVSRESKWFIEALLRKNPPARLGSSRNDCVDVERHPFFATIDWMALLNKRIPPPFVPALTSDYDTRYFENVARSRRLY